MNKNVNYLVKVGVLSAIALVLYYIEFPILPAFPWLMGDFSEVPVLIGGFALGPIAGIIIEALKNILHLLFKGGTGGIGELVNFLLGLGFVLPAVLIYKNKKNRVRAVIGMLIGVVGACLVSIAINYILISTGVWPLPGNVWDYIIMGAVPFTAIKYLLNAVVVFIIYPRLSGIIHKKY